MYVSRTEKETIKFHIILSLFFWHHRVLSWFHNATAFDGGLLMNLDQEQSRSFGVIRSRRSILKATTKPLEGPPSMPSSDCSPDDIQGGSNRDWSDTRKEQPSRDFTRRRIY
jgi:hypothetical protein